MKVRNLVLYQFVLMNGVHFVAINLDKGHWTKPEADGDIMGHDWLGSSSEILRAGGVIDSTLSFLCRREYTIDCNWKVFCDNYLDGGYHVLYAHRGLASGLELDAYTTEIYEKVSIQRRHCGSTGGEGDFDRLGSEALYAFIYPNFIINRYGPWMDTKLGPGKCLVVFDYFLDQSLKIEDIKLCEGVKRGLQSPACNCGRYAATVEKAMHHFHCLLHTNLAG
ncbi:Choline monooxygenase, chloroplastic-like protein [Drosera capensis]